MVSGGSSLHACHVSAVSRLGSPARDDQADDLVQEACEKALRNLHQWQPGYVARQLALSHRSERMDRYLTVGRSEAASCRARRSGDDRGGRRATRNKCATHAVLRAASPANAEPRSAFGHPLGMRGGSVLRGDGAVARLADGNRDEPTRTCTSPAPSAGRRIVRNRAKGKKTSEVSDATV